MLLNLLRRRLSRLAGQPLRRTVIFCLFQLYDLPLAFGAAFFIIMKWAEIRNAMLAPFFGAGLGRRTFLNVFCYSLRPYGYWVLLPYMPRR